MKKEKIYSDKMRKVPEILTEVSAYYSQVYHGSAAYFSGISNATEIKFAFFLIEKMGEDGKVAINPEVIREFAKSVGMISTEATILPYVHKMKQSLILNKILLQIEKRTYMINPIIVWKGKVAERKKVIRALLETGHKITIENNDAKSV